MTYEYKAIEEPLLKSDEIPAGSVIVSRAVIKVTANGEAYNKYTALVYRDTNGKKFAVYLDKAKGCFRSVPVEE